jgi:hypothetical protein
MLSVVALTPSREVGTDCFDQPENKAKRHMTAVRRLRPLPRPGRRALATAPRWLPKEQLRAIAGACPRSPREAASGQGTNRNRGRRHRRALRETRISSPSHADTASGPGGPSTELSRRVRKARLPNRPTHLAVSDRTRPDKAIGFLPSPSGLSRQRENPLTTASGLMTMAGGLDDHRRLGKRANCGVL